MVCDTYSILVDKMIVAHGVPLEYAVIFIQAIMMEYSRDQDIAVTIVREAALGGDHNG